MLSAHHSPATLSVRTPAHLDNFTQNIVFCIQAASHCRGTEREREWAGDLSRKVYKYVTLLEMILSLNPSCTKKLKYGQFSRDKVSTGKGF